ncbi:hypothetical protein AT6N2_C1059 [Agrobacterium tumefaciens]|nr:hypothetical protein AT6N2_C1059 [Agrobacterium tumefaciens]
MRAFKFVQHCISPSGRNVGLFFLTVRIDVERTGDTADDLVGNDDLAYAFQRRQFEHGVQQDLFHDRAQATGTGLAGDRLAGDFAQRVLVEGQFHIFHLEQALILLDQSVLRLGQDLDQRIFIQVFQRRQNGQTANEFRNEAELHQIFRLQLAQHFAHTPVVFRLDGRTEADRGLFATGRDDLVEAGKGAAADEQDVGRIHLQELLLRMLASTLRRNGSDRAFHDLQKRLLNALARHVARDGRVVRLAGNLVDFVDIDDAALSALDIVIRCLQQLQDDVFHVLADITGFGQRRCVRHGEGNVDDAGERLGKIGLAATRRADEHNVRLRKLDIAILGGVREALVVVVNGHGQDLLRLLLADDVFVEDLDDVLRGGYTLARLHHRRLVLLADDVHAQFDAFIADEHRRSGNEFPDFVLALAAE